MKQPSQPQNSPGSQPNPKKTTIQREFYVCFCAKNYNSYSALYLHAKKKHEQNLSMKFLKYTRHQWSGNVKNIYHEFVETMSDAQDEDSYEEEGRRKDSRSSLGSGKENCEGGSKDGGSPRMQAEDVKRLNDVFDRYLSYRKKQQTRTTLLKTFQKYLTTSYKNAKSQPHQFPTPLDFIPHQINHFFQAHSPKPNPLKQQHIKQLEQFSDWLYCNNFTCYLAIGRENYEKFMQKVQDQGDLVCLVEEEVQEEGEGVKKEQG